MNISAAEITAPAVENVGITDDTLSVELSDGRTISAPLAWFPRLLHASKEERGRWRLIGRGQGIHWEEIDEDISVEGMLRGVPAHRPKSSVRLSRPQANGRRAPSNNRLKRSDKARRSTAKREASSK